MTTLRVTIETLPPKRGVFAYRPLLAGVVDSQHGPVEVQLMLEQAHPGEERRPAVLAVAFQTADAPVGVAYHIDVTDFLEALVREHFEANPDDRPPVSHGVH